MPAHEQRSDVWTLADRIQMDLRSAQAKLTELRSQLAALDVKPTGALVCPECSVSFRSRTRLDEHRYYTHDGPLPLHIVAAEARAADPDDPDTSAGDWERDEAEWRRGGDPELPEEL